MSFAYPWILTACIPLAIIVWYALRRKPLPSILAPSAKPFQRQDGKDGRRLAISLPLLLYAAAAAVMIAALARPRQGEEKVVVRAEGIDIILALDLSGSMQIIDVPRRITDNNQLRKALASGELQNRLEIAKKEIRSFVEKRPNDRIGLIGFAGSPYNVCPPTLDHAWLLSHLERLEPGMLDDGTGLAAPVASAVHRLEKSEAKRRVLVLFTDGANNINARITPVQAAQLAKASNVVVYTVGIGSQNAFVVDNSFGMSRIVPVRDEFDEPLLREIAAVADGKYYQAFDIEGLAEVMGDINKLEKTSVEQPRYIEYRETAPLLAAIALALLLLGFVAENTFSLSVP